MIVDQNKLPIALGDSHHGLGRLSLYHQAKGSMLNAQLPFGAPDTRLPTISIIFLGKWSMGKEHERCLAFHQGPLLSVKQGSYCTKSYVILFTGKTIVWKNDWAMFFLEPY